MCCCAKPNINGQPGYSWDGKTIGTRPVHAPELKDGELLLFDEPGRCGGMDSHSHHYRLVRHFGLHLLVRHGGGEERIRLSVPERGRRSDFGFESMDSNTRYWIFNAIYHAHFDAALASRDKTAGQYSQAFIDGRLKKRRSRHTVRVWIEPAPAPESAA